MTRFPRVLARRILRLDTGTTSEAQQRPNPLGIWSYESITMQFGTEHG